MNFFERYKNLCKSENKTPTGVALELGISRASVNRWKNCGTPNSDAIIMIAKYFNVSTDYLLGNTDVISPPNSYNPDDIAKLLLFETVNVPDDIWKRIKDYCDFLKSKNNI